MLALLVTVALGVAAPVAAPTLRWSAPAACPDAAEVDARIEQLLGRPRVDPDLQIAGVVASEPGGWALELTLARGSAAGRRRRLVASRCETLADAAALLVAVEVDPLAAAGAIAWSGPGGPPPPSEEGDARNRAASEGAAIEDAASEEAAREDAASDHAAREDAASDHAAMLEARPRGDVWLDETDAAMTDAPAPRASDAWSWGLRVGGGVELGALPGLAGAVQAAIVAHRRQLHLELSGSFFPPRTRALGRPAGASVRVLQGVAGLRVCARPSLGALAIPLCAGLEAGAMEGVGVGVGGARDERRLWLAAVVAPSAIWSLHPRVGLVVGAEIAAPIVRPSFLLEAEAPADDVVAHLPAPVSGRLLVGLVFALARAPAPAAAGR